MLLLQKLNRRPRVTTVLAPIVVLKLRLDVGRLLTILGLVARAIRLSSFLLVVIVVIFLGTLTFRPMMLFIGSLKVVWWVTTPWLASGRGVVLLTGVWQWLAQKWPHRAVQARGRRVVGVRIMVLISVLGTIMLCVGRAFVVIILLIRMTMILFEPCVVTVRVRPLRTRVLCLTATPLCRLVAELCSKVIRTGTVPKNSCLMLLTAISLIRLLSVVVSTWLLLRCGLIKALSFIRSRALGPFVVTLWQRRETMFRGKP